MAVSLITNPGDFLPAYNNIEWVFSSTNSARCDFVFICDLYVNGAFAIRLQAEPEGVNSYGHFELSRVLQDYISKEFKHDITAFSGNSSSAVSYYIEIREQYNSNYATTCIGPKTLSNVEYTSTVTTYGESYAWGGALQYNEVPAFTIQKYVAINMGSKFLTNVNGTIRVKPTQNYVLSYLQIYSTYEVDSFEIKTYDCSGSVIGTYNIYNSTSPPANDKHVSIGVGPGNLNEYSQTLSPPVDWIDSDVCTYTVRLLDSSPSALSQLQTFELDYSCTKFKSYIIWWLNRLQGYDCFAFDLYSSRNISGSSESLTNVLETGYTLGDRGETVINVDAREAYTFNRDWVRAHEAKWLEDLYTSPDIYLTESSNVHYSIGILGAVHNVDGTTDFVLNVPAGVTLITGSEFTYTVVDGSFIGMANSGSGTITGLDPVTGFYTTTVLSSIAAATNTTGTLEVDILESTMIPMVRTTNTYEDKSVIPTITRNRTYSIELRPSYKINIQSF